MSLGKDYRSVLDAKRSVEDKARQKVARADTRRLSGWFNNIAANLPELMEEKVKAMQAGENGPSMHWTYAEDFRSYTGKSYNKTAGFKAFTEACCGLDIDFECDVEDGYDMTDSRIKELVVRLRPDRPYDPTKSPDYVALGL